MVAHTPDLTTLRVLDTLTAAANLYTSAVNERLLMSQAIRASRITPAALRETLRYTVQQEAQSAVVNKMGTKAEQATLETLAVPDATMNAFRAGMVTLLTSQSDRVTLPDFNRVANQRISIVFDIANQAIRNATGQATAG